jgi:hypothetical protein
MPPAWDSRRNGRQYLVGNGVGPLCQISNRDLLVSVGSDEDNLVTVVCARRSNIDHGLVHAYASDDVVAVSVDENLGSI